MNKLEWLRERQKGIGGSDVSALMGISKYKTPMELYIDKTEPITDVKSSSEAARQGTDLEDYVAKRFEEVTGKKVRRDNKHLIHKDYPFIVANIDRRIVGEKDAILECKTVSSYKAKEWEGEEAPPEYILQCQHYMAVTGAKRVYLAYLIYSTAFDYKVIERDDELIEMIIEAEKEFWHKVENKIPPTLDGSSAAEKWIKEKYAKSVEGKIIDLDNEYVSKIENYLALKEQKYDLDKQIKEIENQIKHELKDAEGATAKGYLISFKNSISNRIDAEKLKTEFSEVYDKVLKQSTSRRFLIKGMN